MEMYRPTFAEINLDHLAHNVGLIQRAFPTAPFLCPMVKANAYGHGDVIVCRFLETLGIKTLGVCLIEEGLRLRDHGIQSEILVFRGFNKAGAEELVRKQMTPVVSTWEQLEILENLNSGTPIGIHLKFDTGMNRLGFVPAEGQKLFDRLWQNKKLRVQALATHLFNGEDAESETGLSAGQLQQLNQLVKMFKPFNIFSHVLNSSGVLSAMALKQQVQQQIQQQSGSAPLILQNWGLRPGLMIYGYNPLHPGGTGPASLRGVMSLKAKVTLFRHLQAGETVSYNGTWKAKKTSVIGVLPIGYADGYHRTLSNQASVIFAGQRVPLVGNVCMDYLMIDVTSLAQGHSFESFVERYREQEVVLFGFAGSEFLSPEELASKAHSITWEILTSVSERVPRFYVGGGQA